MSTPAIPIEVATPPAPAKVGITALLLCAVLSTTLSLLASGGVAFWAMRTGKLGTAATAQAAKPEVPVASHVLVLEPILVNLADGSRQSYLRAGVSLRIADEVKAKGEKAEEGKGDKAAAGPAAEMRDTTLMVLSNESPETLLAKGGREALKSALKDAFREHNAGVHVLDVYLTELLVQRG